MSTADRYTFQVEWSAEDESYLALALEFPGVSAFGGTMDEALREATVAVEGVLEVMAEDGQVAPEPLTARKCSGRVLLRVTPDVHMRATMEAERNRTSLNSWLAEAVVERLGRTQPTKKPSKRGKR